MVQPDASSPCDRPPMPWGRVFGVLEACLGRPLVVLLPGGVALLAALAVAHLLPQRYRASASLHVEWDKEEVEALRRVGADVTNRGLQAARERISDRRALQGILREAAPDGAESAATVSLAEQLEALAAAVSVRSQDGGLFVVECEQGDPARAAILANRLAMLLIEQTESERAMKAQADPALLEGRLGEARAAMDAALVALRRGPEAGSSVAPGEPNGTAPLQPEQLQEERDTLAAALAAARARAGHLRQEIDAGTPPPATNEAVSAELARLRAERVDLLRKYTEQHPDVVEVTDRIRRLEAETPEAQAPDAEALRAALGRAEAEIDALTRRDGELAAEIGRSGRARSAGEGLVSPEIARDLASLTGDFERAQATYLALQEQWRAADAAWRLSPGASPRFRMLREAGVPERPHLPSRLLFGLLGLSVGLALGAFLAVVAELRDPTVRGPDDLEELFPEPLLAEIPLVRVTRPSAVDEPGPLTGT